jgi:hypothetical protein
MGITGTYARNDHSILQKAWQEFEYLFDIAEAMCDAYIEFYWIFIVFFELIFQMVFMP